MYNKQVGVALEEGTQTLSPFYMTRCCGPRSADVLVVFGFDKPKRGVILLSL